MQRRWPPLMKGRLPGVTSPGSRRLARGARPRRYGPVPRGDVPGRPPGLDHEDPRSTRLARAAAVRVPGVGRLGVRASGRERPELPATLELLCCQMPSHPSNRDVPVVTRPLAVLPRGRACEIGRGEFGTPPGDVSLCVTLVLPRRVEGRGSVGISPLGETQTSERASSKGSTRRERAQGCREGWRRTRPVAREFRRRQLRERLEMAPATVLKVGGLSPQGLEFGCRHFSRWAPFPSRGVFEPRAEGILPLYPTVLELEQVARSNERQPPPFRVIGQTPFAFATLPSSATRVISCRRSPRKRAVRTRHTPRCRPRALAANTVS